MQFPDYIEWDLFDHPWGIISDTTIIYVGLTRCDLIISAK